MHKYTIRFYLLLLLILGVILGFTILILSISVPTPSSYRPGYPPDGTYPLHSYSADNNYVTFLADPESDGSYNFYFADLNIVTVIPGTDATTHPLVIVSRNETAQPLIQFYIPPSK